MYFHMHFAMKKLYYMFMGRKINKNFIYSERKKYYFLRKTQILREENVGKRK